MKYVAIIPLENPISMRKETDGWRKFHVSVGRRNSFFQAFFSNYHEFISTIRDSLRELSNFITLFGQLKGISENIRDPFFGNSPYKNLWKRFYSWNQTQFSRNQMILSREYQISNEHTELVMQNRSRTCEKFGICTYEFPRNLNREIWTLIENPQFLKANLTTLETVDQLWGIWHISAGICSYLSRQSFAC